jgi:hypothetical protein
MNLLDYVNFVSQGVSSNTGKGGGGGNVTSYNYSASVVCGLAEGPIGGIPTVWKDKDVTTLSALGLTLFTGAGGQAAWSYLTSNFPTHAVPYDHTAYVAEANMALGSSTSLPNYTFEVQGFLQFNYPTIPDCDMSAVLLDYCTDPNHGANFPYLDSGIQGTNSFQSYTLAVGLLTSPYEDTQRPAADFIKELLQIGNSNCVNSAGILKVIPYADTAVSGNGHSYTPNLSPEFAFTDDDYLPNTQGGSQSSDPVQVTRKSLKETYNTVRIEYNDRSNAYNTSVAQWQDDNDIAIYGVRVMQNMTLKQITTGAVAQLAATLIGQRQLYIRNSYTFSVRADYSMLEPMDLVSITDANLGITNKLVRITQTIDDENDVFTITAEEMYVGTASAPVYNFQASQGYAANFAVTPPSVATPVIFDLPPLLSDAGGGFELACAVGPGAAGSYGGCNVYASLDNVTYQAVGTMQDSSRFGTLATTFPNVADPDTTSTPHFQLNQPTTTLQQLSSGTTSDYQNLRTLMWVDGEFVAYETASLISSGTYTLSTFRRGQYGTSPASHAVNAQWARIDQLLFRMPIDPGLTGQTIYFKFCAFNSYGRQTQSLATATAYAHTIGLNNGQITPASWYGRGGCTVTGNRGYKNTGTTAAWNADIVTNKTYSNGASLSWEPSQTNAYIMGGLSTALPSGVGNYASLPFALYTTASGLIDVYENGTSQGLSIAYSAGDTCQITYDGSFIRYLHNGAVIRQVNAPISLTLLGAFVFDTPGGAIQNIDFESGTTATAAQFIARGAAYVSDSFAGKAQGTSGVWDSDIVSIASYKTCNVVFKPNDATNHLMCGLLDSMLPAPTTTTYNEIDYAIYCAAGTLTVFESGTSIGTFGTYTAQDRFAITYDGSTVTYLKNGTSFRTVSTSGRTFYAGATFFENSAGLNSLDWGPGSVVPIIDTSALNTNAASQILSAFTSSTTGTQVYTSVSPVSATLISGTVTCTGAPVAIDWSVNYVCQQQAGGALTSFDFVVLRDGVALSTGQGEYSNSAPQIDTVASAYHLATMTLTDTPSAGSHTYALQVTITGTGAGPGTPFSGGFITTKNQFLKIREIKR